MFGGLPGPPSARGAYLIFLGYIGLPMSILITIPDSPLKLVLPVYIPPKLL